MEDFKQYIKAYENGVAINNEMVKDEEISNIRKEYLWADEIGKSYNHYLEAFPDSEFEGVNKIRDEFLSNLKYRLYYQDEYEYF